MLQTENKDSRSNKFLMEASEEAKKGDYGKAIQRFNVSMGCLKKDTDEKILDLAYTLFNELVDHIHSFSEIENSLIKLLSASADPYFEEKQQQLACKAAEWFFKRAEKPEVNASDFKKAVLYIGQALCFPRVSNEINKLAAKIFRGASVQHSTFINCLEKAAGRQDMQEMYRLKDSLSSRFKHLPCKADRDDFLRLLDEQIIALFESIHRNMGEKRLESWGIEELLPDDKSQKILQHYAPIDIFDRFITTRYKLNLKEFRQSFRERFDNSTEDVRGFQKEISAELTDFIRGMLKDAIAILGDPPCHYDVRAMGSLGKEEICPNSDLEWCILVEKSEEIPYFIKLAKLLELQIIVLGETPDDAIPVFTCLGKRKRSGLHIDNGPPNSNELIGTPESLAKHLVTDDYQPFSIANTLRKTISIDQSTDALFKEFLDNVHSHLEPMRKKYAAQLLRVRLQQFEKNWDKPFQSHVHLKEHYSELLNHLLNDFSLYFKIEEPNTLDVIDKLVKKEVFTEQSGVLLKEAVSAIYLARVGLHLEKGEQTENFSMQEEDWTQKALEKAYWLVLRPLYRELKKCFQGEELCLERHFKNFDLIDNAFFEEELSPKSIGDFLPLIKHLAHHLARNHPSYLTHKALYKRLSVLTFAEPLREAYFKTLELYAKNDAIAVFLPYLASIPNPYGYRQSHRLEEEHLQKAILKMTDLHPGTFHAKIRCPALPNGAFLKDDIARQIFDENGDIKRQYKSAHSVAKASFVDDKGIEYTLHFKQKPIHPMMEYAVHSLSGRIGGHLTPSTQLARFEVKGKKKAYPVLISQTVHGSTLQEKEKEGYIGWLDPEQFTWACLAAILTRPGDGRLTNYVVQKDTDRIFCVDNDISFLEPITTSFLSKTINFTSALFSLNPKPLEESVLKAFVDLSPDLILRSWCEELVVKDAAYHNLCLFTEKEEERLYNENKEGFKATLLLRSGTTATLLVQFHHLQDAVRHALKENKPLYPSDLLKSLVTLRDTQIQPLISYLEPHSHTVSVNKRLEKAVNRNVDISLTCSQSNWANFGKLPKYQEIQKREEFSPEKALEELLSFTLSQCDSGVNLIANKDNYVVYADFRRMVKEGVSDKERQFFVLKALMHRIESEGIKVREMNIINCTVLDAAALKPFLHDKLEILNLSGCPLIKEDAILEIEKECPHLKKLYLNHCSQLRAFEKPSLFGLPDYLRFEELEELQLSHCKKLTSISLFSTVLKGLKMNKNPVLKRAFFKQENLYSIGNFRGCPNLDLYGSKVREIKKQEIEFRKELKASRAAAMETTAEGTEVWEDPKLLRANVRAKAKEDIWRANAKLGDRLNRLLKGEEMSGLNLHKD